MSETVKDVLDKNRVMNKVADIIDDLDFLVADIDRGRPWGAFFRLKDSEAERFIETYFADIKDQFETFEGLSPKYLIIAPGASLSWQYHRKRAERWRVLDGTVGVKLSDSDTLPEEELILHQGQMVEFPAQKRHRLIGKDNWAIVAEIWQHIDPDNPSDENDIVRIQDDFGR